MQRASSSLVTKKQEMLKNQTHKLKTSKIFHQNYNLVISEFKTPEFGQSPGSVPEEKKAAPGIRIL